MTGTLAPSRHAGAAAWPATGSLVVCEQGSLRLPESPHNLAWGDEDARTPYITALTSISRIRLAIPGVRLTRAKETTS